MSQKVINQRSKEKNETKHIKDSKPIKSTIQNKKKEKDKKSCHEPKYFNNIYNIVNATKHFQCLKPIKTTIQNPNVTSNFKFPLPTIQNT